jgi:endoglucanase
MKWMFFIITLLFFSGCRQSLPDPDPVEGKESENDSGFLPLRPENGLCDLDGVNFGHAFRRGINMGVFDDKEAPDNIIRYFAMLQDRFDFIRLQIPWSSHTGMDSPYAIEPAFFADVDAVADRALDSRLGIILNVYGFDETGQEPELYKEKLYAIWHQLAEHYRSAPEKLVFEVMNEPAGKLDTQSWNHYQNECVAIIRKSNPKRKIIVSTGSYGGYSEINDLILPMDRNLVLSAHFYDPFKFTHQGADWPGTLDMNQYLGTKWTATDAEKQDIEGTFRKIRAWSEATGVPVFLGEFGSYHEADMQSRLRWTRYVAGLAEQYGFAWCYWDFKGDFGLYDPAANSFNGLLEALVPAGGVYGNDYGSKHGAPPITVTQSAGKFGPAKYDTPLLVDSQYFWTGYASIYDASGVVNVVMGETPDWASILIPLSGLYDKGSRFSNNVCELGVRNINNSITDLAINLDTGLNESSGKAIEARLLTLGASDLVHGNGSSVIKNQDGTLRISLDLQSVYYDLKGYIVEDKVRLKLFLESIPDRRQRDQGGSMDFISIILR